MGQAAAVLRPHAPAPQPTAAVRQVDWRFLLPAPDGAFERLILHGGSPALEATVRDLGLAAEIVSDPTDPVAGEAVIALAGASVSPERLTAEVADTGALYWEIDRRLPGNLVLTPARVFERLAASGLTPTAAYWVKPGFPERQMYLPIASPAAFRWYLNTLYGTHTRHRRILKRLLGAVAGTGRLGTVAPCFVVTAVRGAVRPPALVEAVGAAQAWGEGKAHPVLLASATAEWSRVALLLFGDDEAAIPTLLKLPRIDAFNAQVAWEHRVVQTLHRKLSPSLRGSIPTSRLTEWNGLTVATETYMTGAALSSRVGRTTIEALEDLRLAASWLAAFHHETTVDRATGSGWLKQHLVTGLCREYAQTFRLSTAESHLFEVVGRSAAACALASLPLAWHHTDFGPWNVYRDGNDLRVIDWEVARVGPVLADLMYFAAHWSAAVRNLTTDAERIAHCVSLLCTRTAADPLSRAIREELAGYMHRVGLHASLFPFVLVYTFVEQALDLAQRFASIGADAADRDGNTYVGYVHALAEHTDTLFGGEAHVR